MEVLSLLEQMESLLTSSTRVPATRKALVDLDRLLSLVDQLRLSIPKDIQEAEEILARRESIMNQALLEARRIKSAADDEARARVDQNEVYREATRRAEALLAEAQRKAEALLAEAQRKAEAVRREAAAFADSRIADCNKYAQEVLLKLEGLLSSQLASVRRGLDLLDMEQSPRQEARVG